MEEYLGAIDVLKETDLELNVPKDKGVINVLEENNPKFDVPKEAGPKPSDD